MSQHDTVTGAPQLNGGPDTEAIDQMRSILEETRLRLLQQILAYDDGALSVEELAYRNTDLKERTIDYHLRKLESHGVAKRLKVTDGQRNDVPNTYWAVTQTGVDLLKRLGFYDEIAILSEADHALERTDRIRELEAFEARPQPDWY